MFVSYSVIANLLPFDVKDSSDGAMVEGFKLFFVLTGKVPYFTPLVNGIDGKQCEDVELHSDVYILVVEEVLGDTHYGFGFFDLGFDF